MPLVTPFAQMPSTPEPIIAQVRRQLSDDVPQGMTVEDTVLDSVATYAVRELWESRIKTFVPVLALRQAREVLREQDLLMTAEPREVRSSDESTEISPQVERSRRDVLAIQGDVMTHDDQDVLLL
jgi:hypothetical protein